MLENKTVTIIGLGLMGGSMAKALQKYLPPQKLYAVSLLQEELDDAINEGIISQGFTELAHPEVLQSDIIILCTPVKIAIQYLAQLNEKLKPDCIVTDVCSTKGEIVRFVESLNKPMRFVGGHPMAGRENSGYRASSAELFMNATCILSPTQTTDEDTFSFVFKLFEGIGGHCVELNAQAQDNATAAISHLPHIAAFTLVDLVRELRDPNLKILAAGGFKDITRVASSNPLMWENILLTNQTAILKVLNQYIHKLEDFKHMIENNASEELKSLMFRAGEYRKSIP